MTKKVSLHAIIHGRVQGVFFRDFIDTRANRLGITGYVRNLPDGSVEVQAEGERERIEELIDCLRAGSPAAGVEKVVTAWSEYTGDYSSFNIRY